MKRKRLSNEERLRLLRENDSYHFWYSLDDDRFCARCTKVFSGRQILVKRRPDGGAFLHCPTPDCDSLPLHWLFCGSPIRRTKNAARVAGVCPW